MKMMNNPPHAAFCTLRQIILHVRSTQHTLGAAADYAGLQGGILIYEDTEN